MRSACSPEAARRQRVEQRLQLLLQVRANGRTEFVDSVEHSERTHPGSMSLQIRSHNPGRCVIGAMVLQVGALIAPAKQFEVGAQGLDLLRRL